MSDEDKRDLNTGAEASGAPEAGEGSRAPQGRRPPRVEEADIQEAEAETSFSGRRSAVSAPRKLLRITRILIL